MPGTEATATILGAGMHMHVMRTARQHAGAGWQSPFKACITLSSVLAGTLLSTLLLTQYHCGGCFGATMGFFAGGVICFLPTVNVEEETLRCGALIFF